MKKFLFILATWGAFLAGCSQQEPQVVNIYITEQNDSTGATDPTLSGYNFTQGNLKQTGITTDLAIQGKGFFALTKADSLVYYRRPGHFRMNNRGFWVLSSDSLAYLQAIPLINIDSLPVVSSIPQVPGDSLTIATLHALRFGMVGNISDFILPARATSEVRLGGNLDADGEGLGTILHTKRFLAVPDKGEYLTSIFDGSGNFLGITIGDILTVRGYDANGNEYSQSMEVAYSSTISDLVKTIKGIVSNVDTGITVTLIENGTIRVSAYNCKGPINNLSVSSDRSGSDSFVSNAFTWGTTIPITLVNGVASASLLRPANANDTLSTLRDASGLALGYGFEDGDIISINGAIGGKTIIPGILTYNNKTTVQQLLDAIQNAYGLSKFDESSQNSRSVEILSAQTTIVSIPAGTIVIRGKASLAFSLDNISIAANNSNNNAVTPVRFNANMSTATVQSARNPTSVSDSISVFDATGKIHTLFTTFTHSNTPGIWLWKNAVDIGDSIMGGASGKLFFKQNGALLSSIATDSSEFFSFKPKNDSRIVRISLNTGTLGQYNGITQFRDTITTRFLSQDGYSVGHYKSLSMDPYTGTMIGLFTNGVSWPLYKIPVATFLNNAELTYSNGYFAENQNSGKAVFKYPSAAAALEIFGESLELEP